MITPIFYALLATLTLSLALHHYKHSGWIILSGSLAEFVSMLLIYASTFITCSNSESCGGNWGSIIPALFATMNIGIIWPILAAYARQAEKDAQRLKEQAEQQ